MTRCRSCNLPAASPIPCEGNSFLCETCAAAALDIALPAAIEKGEEGGPESPADGEGPDGDG